MTAVTPVHPTKVGEDEKKKGKVLRRGRGKSLGGRTGDTTPSLFSETRVLVDGDYPKYKKHPSKRRIYYLCFTIVIL